MTAQYPSLNIRLNGMIFIFIATLLSGCASTGGNVKVIDGKDRGTPEATKPTRIEKSKGKSPPTPVIAPPRSSAAQTLLARANTALREEEPGTAIVLLERAVRIEPREAQLWIRLSKAHLDQGDTQIAFQHARKAIALAGSERNKQTAAWLQLANVYAAQGRNSDAQNIRQRYGRSSG
ncbi:MAG: tetratricopeptide repeat protein [Pseudomonadales bacterium]|nr:tetratricopeptide repeat protein [Pseudomonadales bacterium]